MILCEQYIIERESERDGVNEKDEARVRDEAFSVIYTLQLTYKRG